MTLLLKEFLLVHQRNSSLCYPDRRLCIFCRLIHGPSLECRPVVSIWDGLACRDESFVFPSISLVQRGEAKVKLQLVLFNSWSPSGSWVHKFLVEYCEYDKFSRFHQWFNSGSTLLLLELAHSRWFLPAYYQGRPKNAEMRLTSP